MLIYLVDPCVTCYKYVIVKSKLPSANLGGEGKMEPKSTNQTAKPDYFCYGSIFPLILFLNSDCSVLNCSTALSNELTIICQDELLSFIFEASFSSFSKFQPPSLTSSSTKAFKYQHLLVEVWKCWLHIVLGDRPEELLTY